MAIKNLEERGAGALPDDVYNYSGEKLGRVLVDLQAQRVKLNRDVRDARQWRDEAVSRVTKAEQQAEGEALTKLPPGRGKTTPSTAAIKEFVSAHPSVISAKEERLACSRKVAHLDDQLGAVRSGLRVVGQLLELELAKKRPATPEDW